MPKLLAKLLLLLAVGAALMALSLWGIPQLELEQEKTDLVTVIVTIADFLITGLTALALFRNDDATS